MAKSSKKDIQQTIEKKYLHAVRSTQYRRWLELSKESYRFYDNEQYTAEELKELRDRNQPDIVINEIAPKVDALSSTESTSRTIISFRHRTFEKQDIVMGEALTAYAMQIQELEDGKYKISEAFADSLKGGIGWIGLSRNEEDRICIEIPDVYEMVWDIDDLSTNMDNQGMVHRHKWMDIEDAKIAFPAHASKLDKLMNVRDPNADLAGITISDKYDNEIMDFFVDDKLDKVKVIETQYTIPAKKYRYQTPDDRFKEVFSEQEANKKKKKGTEVDEIDSHQIMQGYWAMGILLSHAPLAYQTGKFEYIPLVYKRRRSDGVPMGIIEAAKDPQRELNKRRSKMMHLLNTRGVLVEGGSIDDIEVFRKEITRPDPVIITNPGSRIEFLNNLQLADSQFRVMQQSKEDIQAVTGVRDELLGAQTNATSGKAQEIRQRSSLRTQAFAFDRLSLFKKRFGRTLLAMMQSAMDQPMYVNIFRPNDPDFKISILLNAPYEDDNGNTLIERDITTAEFDVVVEEIPDFDAPPEEVAERVTNIVMNGAGNILQSPALAQLLGIRNSQLIAKQLQEAGGAPSPEQGGAGQSAAPQIAAQPSLDGQGG